MKAPSFCYIAPTPYLEFTTASRTHLVLAHLVHTDKQYAEFYRNRKKAGDFIMLDNSAYELKESFSPDLLLDLGKSINADAIVLPDYPFEPAQKTIDAAEKYIPLFKQHGFKSFFVPQSKTGDLHDWIRAYQYGSMNPDIEILGMSILGIPNALNAVDPSYSRVVMTALLQDRGLFNKNKHHHYLGLNAGPALEIPSLIRMGAINTIDSSGPIWAAILGHQYTTEADSMQLVKKLKVPVQFDYKMTKDSDTIARIKHNIAMTQTLFTSTTNSTWYAEE